MRQLKFSTGTVCNSEEHLDVSETRRDSCSRSACFSVDLKPHENDAREICVRRFKLRFAILVICAMSNVSFAEDAASGNVAIFQLPGHEFVTPTAVPNTVVKIKATKA